MRRQIDYSLLLLLLILLTGLAWGEDEQSREYTEKPRKPSKLRGSVSVLFSLAPISEVFQYTHAGGLSQEPTSESGYGFTLDFSDYSGNAFALDYYQLDEEASRTYFSGTTARRYNDSISLFGFMLGYRYHYPMGFYGGLGFWYPNVTVRRNDSASAEPATIKYNPEFIPVIHLGFNGIIGGGFTLGTHIIHSFPVTLELATGTDIQKLSSNGYITGGGELSNVQATAIYLKIGYSW